MSLTKESSLGHWSNRVSTAFKARIESGTRGLGLAGTAAGLPSILEGLGTSTLGESVCR